MAIRLHPTEPTSDEPKPGPKPPVAVVMTALWRDYLRAYRDVLAWFPVTRWFAEVYRQCRDLRQVT